LSSVSSSTSSSRSPPLPLPQNVATNNRGVRPRPSTIINHRGSGVVGVTSLLHSGNGSNRRRISTAVAPSFRSSSVITLDADDDNGITRSENSNVDADPPHHVHHDDDDDTNMSDEEKVEDSNSDNESEDNNDEEAASPSSTISNSPDLKAVSSPPLSLFSKKKVAQGAQQKKQSPAAATAYVYDDDDRFECYCFVWSTERKRPGRWLSNPQPKLLLHQHGTFLQLHVFPFIDSLDRIRLREVCTILSWLDQHRVSSILPSFTLTMMTTTSRQSLSPIERGLPGKHSPSYQPPECHPTTSTHQVKQIALRRPTKQDSGDDDRSSSQPLAPRKWESLIINNVNEVKTATISAWMIPPPISSGRQSSFDMKQLHTIDLSFQPEFTLTKQLAECWSQSPLRVLRLDG
jgi:hypothetical protein